MKREERGDVLFIRLYSLREAFYRWKAVMRFPEMCWVCYEFELLMKFQLIHFFKHKNFPNVTFFFKFCQITSKIVKISFPQLINSFIARKLFYNCDSLNDNTGKSHIRKPFKFHRSPSSLPPQFETSKLNSLDSFIKKLYFTFARAKKSTDKTVNHSRKIVIAQSAPLLGFPKYQSQSCSSLAYTFRLTLTVHLFTSEKCLSGQLKPLKNVTFPSSI